MTVIPLIQSLLELNNYVNILNLLRNKKEIKDDTEYFKALILISRLKYENILGCQFNAFDYLQLYLDSNSKSQELITVENLSSAEAIKISLKNQVKYQDENVQKNLNLLIEKIGDSISKHPKFKDLAKFDEKFRSQYQYTPLSQRK